MQAAIETIQQTVDVMAQKGLLENIEVTLGGKADKLVETRRALQWNFLLAMIITYLLMSALFENFLYPFIIMFSVPLAAAGGFVGLYLINLYVSSFYGAAQSLDIITMLGFVILVGIVVNNAILIVHQTLNNIRNKGLPARDAIADAVRTRIRPIYMSTITTVFGMLPLVLFPGAGSEFYRGLGSVVVGGLLVSTVFTIFLIPALLSLLLDSISAIKRLLRLS